MEIKLKEFDLHLAELSPERESDIESNDEGVTITTPYKYRWDFSSELGFTLEIGQFRLHLEAGLVRQLYAALPPESVH